ncbi:hypothetical protein D3C84_422060 [compost metagenome]
MLEKRSGQSVVVEQQNTGKVCVADQLAALVVVGGNGIVRGISQTLCANRFALQRLLEQRRQSQLIVVVHPTLRTPAVPGLNRLARLAEQTHAQPGIDTQGAQGRAGEAMNRNQIGRCRSHLEQPRIPLRNRPPSGVMNRAIDLSFGDRLLRGTVIIHRT